MELTRTILANELAEQLRVGTRGRQLAAWAHRMYLDHAPLEPGVYEALMQIIATDEGDQFALSDSDLTRILQELRMNR